MENALKIVDALKSVLETCNVPSALKILEDLEKVLKDVSQRKNKTALLKKQNIMCVTKDCLQSVSSKKNNLCTNCNLKLNIAVSVVELLKNQNIMCSTTGCWQCVSSKKNNLCARCNDRREITEKIDHLRKLSDEYKCKRRFYRYSLFESYKETLINQVFQSVINNKQCLYCQSVYEDSDKDDLCMISLVDFQRASYSDCPLLPAIKYGRYVHYEESNLIKITATELFEEYIPIGVSVRQDFITFKAGDVIRFYERW